MTQKEIERKIKSYNRRIAISNSPLKIEQWAVEVSRLKKMLAFTLTDYVPGRVYYRDSSIEPRVGVTRNTSVRLHLERRSSPTHVKARTDWKVKPFLVQLEERGYIHYDFSPKEQLKKTFNI